MARFEGATYLRRLVPLKEVASSKKLVISGWFRCANGEGGTILIGGAGSGSTDKINLSLSQSTGSFTFLVRNSSNTVLWQIATVTAFDDDSVHHLGISADLGNSRGQVYIDGTVQSLTVSQALTDGTIAFADQVEWVFGAHWAGGSPLFTGSCYDFAFWPGVSIDLSDTDELHKLVALDSQRLATSPSNVKPVGYGSEGCYLDTRAAVIFSSGFRKNVGVGGDFALVGTVGEDSAEEAAPSGYRLAARWPTPGERWFESEQTGDPFPRSQTFIETREGLSSHGKRLGLEEMDAPTRRERPGLNFSDLVLGTEEEDDDEDWLR